MIGRHGPFYRRHRNCQISVMGFEFLNIPSLLPILYFSSPPPGRAQLSVAPSSAPSVVVFRSPITAVPNIRYPHPNFQFPVLAHSKEMDAKDAVAILFRWSLMLLLMSADRSTT